MPKQKQSPVNRSAARRKGNSTAFDRFEGVYLFKMVLYLLLGSMWLKISSGTDLSIPVPIGLAIGIVFATHEHFRIDRKLEYAVLLVAMLFGYFAPYGIYIAVS